MEPLTSRRKFLGKASAAFAATIISGKIIADNNYDKDSLVLSNWEAVKRMQNTSSPIAKGAVTSILQWSKNEIINADRFRIIFHTASGGTDNMGVDKWDKAGKKDHKSSNVIPTQLWNLNASATYAAAQKACKDAGFAVFNDTGFALNKTIGWSIRA